MLHEPCRRAWQSGSSIFCLAERSRVCYQRLLHACTFGPGRACACVSVSDPATVAVAVVGEGVGSNLALGARMTFGMRASMTPHTREPRFNQRWKFRNEYTRERNDRD